MNLKESTLLATVRLVEKQLNKQCYDNALELIAQYKLQGFTMTKTRAKSEFNLKDDDFRALSCSIADNPYYKCAPKMKLYLLRELEDKFGKTARREKKIDELLTNNKLEK